MRKGISDGGDSTGGGQMSEGVARLRACVLSHFSHVRLFVTPWTLSRQAPLSTGSSTQECWSGLPFPSPGDLPHPGIEPMSLASPALAGEFFATAPPEKPILKKVIKWFKITVFRHHEWPVREFHKDFLLTPHDQDIKNR